jgi:hypothetical protein
VKKIVRIAASVAVAGSLAFLGNGAVSSWTQVAQASGTTLQTVSKTETLVSPTCFDYKQVTTTYYHWSKTHYVLYPKAKVTVTTGRTCHS